MHGRTNDGAVALAGRLTGILRRREQIFGRGVVSEVQWEMLLRLLAEGGSRNMLCERSLLIGSGTAAVVAARQIDRLVEAGLVWRMGGTDPDDRRQVYLTNATRTRIIRVLDGPGAFAADVRADFLPDITAAPLCG